MSDNSNEGGCVISIGGILAACLSFWKWHSIGWAILHLFLGWLYVIYFVLHYGIQPWHLAPLFP